MAKPTADTMLERAAAKLHEVVDLRVQGASDTVLWYVHRRLITTLDKVSTELAQRSFRKRLDE